MTQCQLRFINQIQFFCVHRDGNSHQDVRQKIIDAVLQIANGKKDIGSTGSLYHSKPKRKKKKRIDMWTYFLQTEEIKYHKKNLGTVTKEK